MSVITITKPNNNVFSFSLEKFCVSQCVWDFKSLNSALCFHTGAFDRGLVCGKKSITLLFKPALSRQDLIGKIDKPSHVVIHADHHVLQKATWSGLNKNLMVMN